LPHSAVPVEPQVGREYGETTAALHLRAKAHKSSYMSKSIYFFPGDAKATLGEVGGKGLSLLESSRALLPVPPGCILTVHFFEPWLSQLKTTDAWKIFLRQAMMLSLMRVQSSNRRQWHFRLLKLKRKF
jgi:hypothetical protein